MLRRLSVVMLAVTIIFLVTGHSCAFRDNIVAAWPLDEGSGSDIHDVSGNGNDGELAGGAEWVDGRFSKALDFDGSSGYIEIPFDDSMKVMNEGDFTLAAWFKPDAVPGENKEVFQQGDSGGTGRTWLLINTSGTINAYVGGGTTTSGINVEPGEWYHTAVVVTEGGGADGIQLYVNGEIAGAPNTLAMEDSEGSYFIGCHKNLTNFWDGIIDDVVLINKALNEAEINDLMENGVESVLAVEPTGKLVVSWGSIKRDAKP
jgi:hypothetical protein